MVVDVVIKSDNLIIVIITYNKGLMYFFYSYSVSKKKGEPIISLKKSAKRVLN